MWFLLALITAGVANDDLGPPIKRVEPAHPPDRPPEPDVDCDVYVAVDDRGVPVEIIVHDCADPFASSAQAALRQWRWTPGQPGYEAVRITFTHPLYQQEREFALFDMSVVAGALHAPRDPSDASDLAGMVRLYMLDSFVELLPKWLVLGEDVDVRGFRIYAVHGAAYAGASVRRGAFGAALTTGIGATGRGTGQDAINKVWIPLRGHMILDVSDAVGFAARGGVDVLLGSTQLAGAGDIGRVAPTAVVGISFGRLVRVEGGYRREFGAPTVTAAVGFGMVHSGRRE